MTTVKITALTRWTFVGKIMSLLFNMLSRLVIVFLPGSKRLLFIYRQAPLSVGILQAGRLSFLPPGNFPTQGSNPHLFTSMSPALAEGFLTPWVRKGMGFHPGKGTTTHSSVLAWRILRTEEPGGLQSMRSQRVRHDWATSTCLPRSTEEAFKRH